VSNITRNCQRSAETLPISSRFSVQDQVTTECPTSTEPRQLGARPEGFEPPTLGLEVRSRPIYRPALFSCFCR
jgi:hypothetical protein